MEISDRPRTSTSISEFSDRPKAPSRAHSAERIAVNALPDLTSRIDAMGLTGEYKAFRERYQAWRNGSAQGAVGSLQPTDIARKYGGFGYWYPSREVWSWRRTLSFWIAVTFFEGSIFFSISSFLFCYKEHFAKYSVAVTTHGYVAGKVNFLLCTYLMCVETVNLTAIGEEDAAGPNNGRSLQTASVSFFGFEWWPFNFREAVARLRRLGAGPYPYYASVIYFIGVNVYIVGLIAEFLPIPHEISSMTTAIAFIIGSFLFVLGGVAECIENEVFVKRKCKVLGWWGALLNLIGGIWFQIGSLLGLFSDLSYYASFSFGIGSVIYAVGAGAMLIMWKDEQFGLTFLSSLNKLGGAQGRPMILRDGETSGKEANTFSWRGAGFLIIYILAATMSTYDGFLSLADVSTENFSLSNAVVRPFYSFLPCVFSHALLAINCAVVKVPADPPFRELYIFCRFLALIMAILCFIHLVETLHDASATVAINSKRFA